MQPALALTLAGVGMAMTWTLSFLVVATVVLLVLCCKFSIRLLVWCLVPTMFLCSLMTFPMIGPLAWLPFVAVLILGQYIGRGEPTGNPASVRVRIQEPKRSSASSSSSESE